jgi:hypothetical protein
VRQSAPCTLRFAPRRRLARPRRLHAPAQLPVAAPHLIHQALHALRQGQAGARPRQAGRQATHT